MNRKQKTRLAGVIALILILSCAAGLILFALKQNINLFYTPTQLLATNATPQQVFRIGGYVKKHSVHYSKTGDSVRFVVTDNQHDLTVNFQGVLPSLFREGQGVVITGRLSDAHEFSASQVLAKHDEKYMPPGLEKALQGNKP